MTKKVLVFRSSPMFRASLPVRPAAAIETVNPGDAGISTQDTNLPVAAKHPQQATQMQANDHPTSQKGVSRQLNLPIVTCGCPVNKLLPQPVHYA